MLEWIRKKFGVALISGIIGFIAFVFVFYGIFSPKSTRGFHEGAVAGKVNGESISISEFNREYGRRIEFMKGILGAQFSEEQAKAFRVKQAVFDDLVRRKLMIQEAHKRDLVASEEQVRDKIKEIPAFAKNGKFDLETYQNLLRANQYTPSSFEKTILEDLSQSRWPEHFKSRMAASESELKRQFALSQDQRKLRFVLLTHESAQKKIAVSETEIQAFLKDPQKLEQARGRFDSQKDQRFKGQKFEQAQTTLARELIGSGKVEEVRKINESLASQVEKALTASASSDRAVNALLKPYDLKIQTSPWISVLDGGFIPGIGESKELNQDLFAARSPIDPSQGGKAKKYFSAAWAVIAVVSETKKPDFSKFEAERPKLAQQISDRKWSEFFEAWLKRLMAKASIEPNPDVLSEG